MTLHRQAENYILNQIQNGTLKPGDQIPTEMKLSELLGVSRPTVRSALTRLAEQGYIVRIKGRGSFVKEAKLLHRSTTMLSGYRQESETHGLHIMTEVISLEEITAGDEIAAKLSIKPRQKIGVLTRLRRVEGYNDGRPVVLTTVYVPLNKIPDFFDYDFTSQSFYEVLSQKGMSVKHASRTLDVVPTQKQAAELLQIGPFDPLIRIVSVGKTDNGTVIEYAESLYPALCSSFQIEIDK